VRMTKVFDGHVHGGLNMEQLGIHDFSCYGLQACSPYTKTLWIAFIKHHK